jgi:hypothetical protein
VQAKPESGLTPNLTARNGGNGTLFPLYTSQLTVPGTLDEKFILGDGELLPPARDNAAVINIYIFYFITLYNSVLSTFRFSIIDDRNVVQMIGVEHPSDQPDL